MLRHDTDAGAEVMMEMLCCAVRQCHPSHPPITHHPSIMLSMPSMLSPITHHPCHPCYPCYPCHPCHHPSPITHRPSHPSHPCSSPITNACSPSSWNLQEGFWSVQRMEPNRQRHFRNPEHIAVLSCWSFTAAPPSSPCPIPIPHL
jgi:hypothetical protein